MMLILAQWYALSQMYLGKDVLVLVGCVDVNFCLLQLTSGKDSFVQMQVVGK